MKKPTRAEWGKALTSDDVEFVRTHASSVDEGQLVVFAQVALTAGRLEVGRYLLETLRLGERPGLREKLLAVVAGAGQVDAVRYLLALGVEDLETELPLVQAAMSGNLEIVRLVLEAGANVNQCISGFENALDVATNDGFEDVAELLRERGAKPGLRS